MDFCLLAIYNIIFVIFCNVFKGVKKFRVLTLPKLILKSNHLVIKITKFIFEFSGSYNFTKMRSSLIYEIFYLQQRNEHLKFKLLVKHAIGINFEKNSIVSHRTMAAYFPLSYLMVFLIYHILLILTSLNDVRC